MTEVGGSSPHARGLLTDGEGGTVVGRIIPACPRMRGVYIRNPIASFTYMGSSPLARGLPPEDQCGARLLRIIPARAGFTSGSRSCCSPRRDHPRSRGVYNPHWEHGIVAEGSSPLARGLQPPLGARYRGRGIIPARAGFTYSFRRHTVTPWDHPRSRGVYGWKINPAVPRPGSSPLARGLRPGRPAAAAPTSGSSPLARGLPGRRPAGHSGGGIIPARAGFTLSRPLRRPSTTDHPRSRGVYAVSDVIDYCNKGSSPLARGLPQDLSAHSSVPGIIPARAGFTLYDHHINIRDRDHPRSRGVYV